ncbi:hypothetical protein SAMN04489712_105278 [Thermomonospora echinospora]|uniref:Uncharacterized protein n=1 Tax=Thermomonospora echinospora TaxID=1992 RepID=A0A1H6A8Y6_9ACTN|nr:phage tail tube protein [Thermomonospora echinospora]SEG44921.1 hypothetical protein SAMN04489712_105278 [Thermomonospora echinospora]
MGTRSGLDAQLGFAAESVYGTGVVPSRFLEFDEEDLRETPTWLEGEGIRAGRKYKRSSRLSISRFDVKGKVDLKAPSKGLGLLLKHMIGSSATATQIASTTAYKQIHTPGDHVGKSLTWQVGRPEPGTGTVRPFTYLGCKCLSWELSVSDGEHVKLSTNWSGREESTSTGLAAASYASGAGLYNFSHASLKLGGTASTSSGEMSVSGGSAVTTVINSISIKGENPMADERYGIGNSGRKSEPLENDYPTLTGSLDAEFSKAELYDVFKSADSIPLELVFAFGDAGGGNPFELSFIGPAITMKEAAPSVNGPGLVRMSTEFEVYDDETNAPYQFRYVSTDTTV